MEIARLQFDWALITAMIERWRPETHTFHLHIGEATITLKDVEVLYGLPIDGIHRLAGFQPVKPTALSGASRLQLTPVRQHQVALHEEITDDSPPEDINSLQFLHHLEWLNDLPGYNWGGAVIAYLYRQLCRSSMGTVRDIVGFIPLLQVWTWEEFLQFQPPLPPLAPDAPPLPFLPLARRWVDWRGHAREVEARHHLPYYRDLLDLLEGAQWDDRCKVDQTYLAWLEAQIEDWDQRYGLILSYPPPDCLDGEHEYMGWYRSVTRLLIGNPVQRAGGRYVPYAGRHEALLGLQMLHHTGEGAAVVYKLGHRVTDLAADTLRCAQEDVRLGYEAAYVTPEEYHHGPQVAFERSRRGRRGQRGMSPLEIGFLVFLPNQVHSPPEFTLKHKGDSICDNLRYYLVGEIAETDWCELRSADAAKIGEDYGRRCEGISALAWSHVWRDGRRSEVCAGAMGNSALAIA
uniref:Aminotransferase-like plant mobile domain-containing protein n=1 Tax=Nicotiana tabacum TaxID=4097 RepID=A0A1S3YNU1_TOBAC|nr:PREDICTED: uncharacterized protein LOC107778220 [Nicotiana tabacum]